MPQLKEKELDDVLAFAIQLGKDAGQMLMDAARLRFGGDASKEQSFTEKDNAVDIVTQTDEGKRMGGWKARAETYPTSDREEGSFFFAFQNECS